MEFADSQNRKLTVAIIYGGKSAEHDVSLRSAANVVKALDTNKFIPVLVSIDRLGVWRIEDNSGISDSEALIVNTSSPQVYFAPGTATLMCSDPSVPNIVIDAVFPVLHGPLGEDGSVQGYLEVVNVPYVGPGVLGSAVGMDKDVMKRLLQDAGIPVASFMSFHESQRSNIRPAI